MARHEWATDGSIRKALFNRISNGLVDAGAVLKMGARVLIDEERFIEWMRGQAEDEARKVRSRRRTGGAA